MFDWLIRMIANYYSSKNGNNALNILTYHRVDEYYDIKNPKNMQKSQFIKQLFWLKKHFVVLPLPEALSLLSKGLLPKRAVCITVDDGYKDSYDIIYQELEKLSLPAAFFISTDGLTQGCLWDERIFNAILGASNEVKSITVADVTYPIENEAQRIACRGKLTEEAKYLTLKERDYFIDEIESQCHAPVVENDFLTIKQIKTMHRAGMTIGAHTHKHPILAKEQADNARHEIYQSKIILEDIIEESVDYFAYPNGKFSTDFTDEHIEMVRDLGFKAALSTDWGALTDLKKDRFKIKRFTPWDITEFKFSLRLAMNYLK